MEINEFIIRKLDINDLNIYIELFNSNEKLLRLKKKQEYSSIMINQFSNDLNNKDKLVYGAFYNDELICAQSGYFPPTIQYWYAFNQFSNFNKKDLNNYKLSMSVWGKCMYMLMEHGEQNNYYSFYSRRDLKHQRALDKVWKRFVSDGIIENKYNCFYETIYKANGTNKEEEVKLNVN